MTRPFTFVVAFTVDPSWIAEGFTICDERAKVMLSQALHGAHGHEIGARVLGFPDALALATAQDYPPGHRERPAHVEKLRAQTLHGDLMRDTLEAALHALRLEDPIPRNTRAIGLLLELKAAANPSTIPGDA